MELSDALTITGLGMAVVFSGLLLTAALIVGLDRVQRLLDRSDPAPPTAPPSSDNVTTNSTGPAIDPEILTVIATILEVERRLHRVGGDRSATSGPS